MESHSKKKKSLKHWLLFTLRWTIAVVGIWYVVRNISLRDTVLISDPTDGRPVPVRVVGTAGDDQPSYAVETSAGRQTVDRHELLVRPGLPRERLQIRNADESVQEVDVLALKVRDDTNRRRWPLVVAPPRTLWQKYSGSISGKAWEVSPDRVVGPYHVQVPYPVVDLGMKRILANADGKYLLAAVVVYPVTVTLCSLRWALLIRMLGIAIRPSRAFTLTMVGNFYNNFMPGSTGGDLVKAYYASKNTPKRTQVILSVLLDRIIGLLALVVLGGSMAAVQWDIPQCRKIALASAAIVALVAIGLTVYYTPVLRRYSGLDFILARLPMQKQVRSARQAMDLYGQHPWLMLTTLLMSLPVHATVVISAYFAGQAFDLPLAARDYWVAVPVIVLSGAIPVSPQGAGVMEFFAILLTRRSGCTVTHAFLLTMSIRLVQMLWNLSGAFFVLRGGYHTPREDAATDDVPAVNASATTSG